MSRNRSLASEESRESRSTHVLRSDGRASVSAWSEPRVAEAEEPEEAEEVSPEETKDSGANAILSLADLPVVLPEKFELSLNPFKLCFPKDVEDEYMEWIHLDYVPFRAWLLTSALVGSLDTVLYGPSSVNVHMVLMYTVEAIQLSVFVAMSFRRLAAYRRYLVYVQFLHVFFWAGLTAQEAAEGLSGMHQNSFMVLPYYCAFICAIFAQIPVRHSLWLMCFLPLANTLWRVLVYYAYPVASVMLVWWLILSLWLYASERITRLLFAWVVTARNLQEIKEREKTAMLALVRSVVPRGVVRHLQACANVNPITSKSGVVVAPAHIRNTFREDPECIIAVLCLITKGKDVLSFSGLETIDEIADKSGFQRIGVSSTRCTFALMGDNGNGDGYASFTSKLAFFVSGTFSALSAESQDGFVVINTAPAVSCLVVTPQLCRPCVLSDGIAEAHRYAAAIETSSFVETNVVFVRRACLSRWSIPSSKAFPLSETATAQGLDESICTVDVSLLETKEAESSLQKGDEQSAAMELFLALSSISSCIQEVDDFLGPVPAINWRAALSRRGLSFVASTHEKNYRKFVLTEVPELYLTLASFAVFSGLWTVVAFVVVIQPCQFRSMSGITPWSIVHGAVFVSSIFFTNRLYRAVRRGDGPAVMRTTVPLFLAMSVHYCVCIVSIYIQPNLLDVGNWKDYVSTFLYGKSHYSHFDNKLCLSTLHDMTYFVLFALLFCLAVVPMFLSTSIRAGIMVLLVTVHTVLASVLLHNFDLLEIGFGACLLGYMIAMEALVRLFYKALLDSNRAHLETEQQRIVISACMPERLLASPNHTFVHRRAGLLCVHFLALTSVLPSAPSIREALSDFASLVAAVQKLLSAFSLTSSIVYLALRDGNPAMMILLHFADEQVDTERAEATHHVAHAIGNLLLGLPLDAYGLPCAFRMSAAMRPVVERSQAGFHSLDSDSVDELEAMLTPCLVNSICFGASIPRFAKAELPVEIYSQLASNRASTRASHTIEATLSLASSHKSALSSTRRPIFVRERSQAAMSASGITACSSAHTATAEERRRSRLSARKPSSSSSRAASYTPGKTSSKASAARKIRRGVVPCSCAVVVTWDPPLVTDRKVSTPLSVSSSVSFHEEDVPKPSSGTRNLRICGVDGAEDYLDLDEPSLSSFNASFVRDLLTIFSVIRQGRVLPRVLQSSSSSKLRLAVLFGDAQTAVNSAYAICGDLWKNNPNTLCVGLGVAAVQGEPLHASFANAAVAAAARLSDSNAANPATPSFAFGLPVMLAASLKQKVEYDYYLKPILSGEDEPIYRLCARQIVETTEWMYELEGAEKSNKYSRYIQAFKKLEAGDLTSAAALLRAYLKDNPEDEDGARLLSGPCSPAE